MTPTERRTLFLVVVGIGLTATPAAAQPAKRDYPGVVNFVQVEPRVATGGAITPEAFARLRTDGVTTVINLRQDGEGGIDVATERQAAEQAGLTYFHIPVSGSDPQLVSAELFLKTVASAATGSLFIHCQSGNRVGAMWLIKRLVQDAWDIERATTEAEAIGLRAPALKQFALDYAKSHPPAVKREP
jgi:uncharacterized protein (TIGR01244 family)